MLSHFSARRYVFTLTAVDTLRLPEYKGSALRGGFGHAFKKIVCTFGSRTCDDCLLKQSCVYSYVFETPPTQGLGRMTNYQRAPHPFVIEPPLTRQEIYPPGEALSFGLVLIGRANDYLPYFIYAFEDLGKSLGIGRGKGRFRLETVGLNGEALYDGATGRLTNAGSRTEPRKPQAAGLGRRGRPTLRFLTPTRIVSDGSLQPDPDFPTIFRALLHRLSLLSLFHCGTAVDFTALIGPAAAVSTAAKSLHWQDWERYSSRHDERMNLGGFIGEMSLDAVASELLPYLEIGELVHLGKGTGFGLGLYEMTL